MKTALVIGATGLVGSELVNLLLADNRFETVKVFVRRSTGRAHAKLQEYIVNFDAMDTWKKHLSGDVLFSALGTTLKQAGGKDAQYKIDFTYQYNVAKAAAENGVPQYVLISSAGASPQSRIFYSRMKGELEEAVKKLSFSNIHILQPGMLQGHRQEPRAGERIGIAVLSVLRSIPGLKKYRPIEGRTVARAMINAAFRKNAPVEVWTLENVFTLTQAG